MKNRTTDYKRWQDHRHSNRKHKIAKSWGWETTQGRFVKGKLHCSCPLCQNKTGKTNLSMTYHRNGRNWKASDLRKPQFDIEA